VHKKLDDGSHEHHSSHESDFEHKSDDSESDLEEFRNGRRSRNQSTRQIHGTRKRSNRNITTSDNDSAGSLKGIENARSTRNRTTREVDDTDTRNNRDAHSSLKPTASHTEKSSPRSPRKGNVDQVNSARTDTKRNKPLKRERSDSDSSHQLARTRTRSSTDRKSYIEPSSSEFGSDASDTENVSPLARPKKKVARRNPPQHVDNKPKSKLIFEKPETLLETHTLSSFLKMEYKPKHEFLKCQRKRGNKWWTSILILLHYQSGQLLLWVISQRLPLLS
jgi:hypothetical protein